MNIVFYAHSGLRYLVLLVGIIALIYFAYGWLAKRPAERGARIMSALFAGLLDLQITLGIILVALGVYYPALIGHMAMMLLAAAIVHGLFVVARRRSDPVRGNALRALATLLALGLIFGGISAIGRSPFDSGSLTIPSQR